MNAVMNISARPPSGPSASTCDGPSVGHDPALDVDRIAGLAKAVSEPLRVRILDALSRSPEPVCQCELIALFGIKQSLLSHHMRKLVDAGLVEAERRHRWVYYSPREGATQELAAWLS
jgi:ArsR family transcriptional regulator